MVLDCKQKTLKHSSADVNTSFLFGERWFTLHKSHFLYNEVPTKGHESYYRILIPQAWDWFHFEWVSLHICTYLSWDLTVICRTSTLDTWQCVHGASPRYDPWLGVSVMSQENGGETALEKWNFSWCSLKPQGPEAGIWPFQRSKQNRIPAWNEEEEQVEKTWVHGIG